MGLYTAAHSNPQGHGDARPTALQIVRDGDFEDKLVGKNIVLTGMSSGIGVETARALSATGATLFLTARDMAKARAAIAEFDHPSRIFLIEMNLASNASVRAAATNILGKSKNQLNILINNAGVMGIPTRQLSEDGYEMHFAANYLGHFLFFQLLKPALLSASTPQFPSRLVNVASSAHRSCTISESEDFNFEKTEYSYAQAYAKAKLACVYMANEADRRYASKGLHATSLHPGGISTEISRYVGPEFVKALYSNEALVKLFKSEEQGAATTVIAAIGQEWADKGGKYLEDCEEAKQGEDDGETFASGYVPQTYDPEMEGYLWKESLAMVGLEDDA